LHSSISSKSSITLDSASIVRLARAARYFMKLLFCWSSFSCSASKKPECYFLIKDLSPENSG
jgi:hypothetical protein